MNKGVVTLLTQKIKIPRVKKKMATHITPKHGLANRLNWVLPLIINGDQTGF